MTVHEIDPRLRGALLRPGDRGYDEGRAAWNRNAHQEPAAVVMAEGAGDVVAGVRFARAEGLGVAVMATGHGTSIPCDGGVLINTSRMSGVRVAGRTRIARVGAGAKWADLAPVAAEHGLAGLPGSGSRVGIVGYTMGGGFGWLGRRYGLASGSVTAADVVTADGRLVRADPFGHADLLWGLRGGGGNFGIVTALEFALHPVVRVYGGNLLYPVERAGEVLAAYAAWADEQPDEMASAVAFRRFPPLPTVPEPLRGRLLMAVRSCWSGADPTDGERRVDVLRAALGRPEVDTCAVLPVTALDTISSDPVDPIGFLGHCELVPDLTPAAIGALVELGSASPLIALELRRLGGALSAPAAQLSPMGRTGARYSLNAIGVTSTPDAVGPIQDYLARLAAAMRPHVTGGTYLNFLDLNGATPHRVRAAYSAADWQRLVELKRRWDPDNVFRFNRNIPPR
ncbi:MAG TPA: FAD-binding oxidoreductase [Pseudonocardia sp.]|nr:FAD-binding oxidoreductase [Pseudonocardia sp.]